MLYWYRLRVIFGIAACMTAVCCNGGLENIHNSAQSIKTHAGATILLANEVKSASDDAVIIDTMENIVGHQSVILDDASEIQAEIASGSVKNTASPWMTLLGNSVYVLGGLAVIIFLWRSGLFRVMRTAITVVLSVFKVSTWRKPKE